MGTIEPMSGEETFAASPARVLAFITDAAALAGTMPGVEGVERVDERTARCVVHPGFSFMRGTMRVTLSIAESDPVRGVVVRTHAQGIGASVEIESRLRLDERDGGKAARVNWEARVTALRGLVAAVPPSLIKGAADKLVRDGWQAVRKRIEGEKGPAPGAA